VIVVIGVAVLGVAAISIAVLSTIGARHPDRAAMIVVLGAAAGGMFAVGFLILGLLGAGLRGTAEPAAAGAVQHDPQRVIAGLAGAVVLLGVAAWLIRTGDWGRDD
jgi:hypothetical protein